jgi:hypothetical protein
MNSKKTDIEYLIWSNFLREDDSEIQYFFINRHQFVCIKYMSSELVLYS